MKKIVIIYLKILNIILILGAVFVQYYFKQSLFINGFLSFTVQSNLFVAVTLFLSLLVKLLLNSKCNKTVFRFIEILEIIAAVAISLTFVIFNFMLAPGLIYKGNISYLFTFQSLVLHFISPVIYVITFLFLEEHKFHINDGFFGIVFPFYYLFFVFLCNFKNIQFNNARSNERYFPYFFMNYYDNGFFNIGSSILEIGFGYWILLLTILTVIITFLYIRIIKNRTSKAKINK